MKKRILGILTAVLALTMVFTMVSCGDKGSDQVTISFNAGFLEGTTTPVTAADVQGLPSRFSIKKNSAPVQGRIPLKGESGAPTLTGHTFEGWATAISATAAAIPAGYLFTANTTLYAMWTAGSGTTTYTVTFENADGTVNKTVPNIAANGLVPQAQFPANPTLAGQVFSGWIIKDSSPEAPFTPQTPVTGNITVVPKFVAEGTTYTVTFEDGYSDPAVTLKTVSDIAPNGNVVQADFPTPTRTGYIFVSWVIKDTTTAFTAQTPVTGNLTVVATWADASTSALVTFMVGTNFDDDFGDYIDSLEVYGSPVVVTIGQAIGSANFPGNPTAPAGFTFAGWYDLADIVAENEDAAAFTSSTVVNADITVVALFDAEGGINYVTVTFNFNYTGAPDNLAKQIEENTPISDAGDDWLPVPEARQGWVFDGWYRSAEFTGTKLGDDDAFASDITVYAKWIEDVLTEETDAELLYLENGASALYQFDLAAGASLADYESVSYQVKISAAAKQIAETAGMGFRHTRLMGVYVPGGANITTDPNGTKAYNLNNYNAPFIINTGPGSGDINNNANADEWYTITVNLTGSSHGDFVAANGADETKTGTVYFGLGITCQNSNKQADMHHQFVQLVKDVKLNPKSSSSAAEVSGKRPEKATAVFPNPNYDVADFVSYVDPIVYSFRAEATQQNIDNWKTLIPTAGPEPEPFDRGPAPAIASLTKVDLTSGSDVFTYVRLASAGNVDNQRGWVSFEEANRANSKDPAAPSSTVVFANFKEAWYLELESAKKPNGEVQLAWMGTLTGWEQKLAINNAGAIADISTIEGDDDNGYVIRFYLPNALGRYQDYYENNTEWAGLALSYWGSGDTSNVTQLGITKASLLVEADAGEAEGVSLGITFSLGTAPAGGALIKDIELDQAGTSLEITTTPGLSDFVWYVDGAKDSETGGTLTLTVATGGGNKVIALLAKRGGKWVSQSVNIALKN